MSKKDKKQKSAPPLASMPPLDYAPPVDVLLTLGVSWSGGKAWPDYGPYNFTSGDVPELRRMATDQRLLFHDEESEAWAPMHALRVLALLGAREAIPDAIEAFIATQDSDWSSEEFPRLFARLGAESLAPLTQLLFDGSVSDDEWLPTSVAHCIADVAEAHPAAREGGLAALHRALENYRENEPEFNAFVIGHLTDLGDTASLPLIEAAFKADCVDETVGGDWNEVRDEWGLPPVAADPFGAIATGIKPRVTDNFFERSIDKSLPRDSAAELLERARKGLVLPRRSAAEILAAARKQNAKQNAPED